MASFEKKILLRPEEEIIYIVRRHKVFLLLPFTLAAVLVVAAFFLMYYLLRQGVWGTSLFLAMLGTAVIYAWREFLVWYGTVLVLTSQRVVDIDQQGFFHRTVSEAGFEKIQDVSYATKGVLQAIFHLGSIKIQTAGNVLTLTLDNIPNPDEAHRLLVDAMRDAGITQGTHIEAKVLSKGQRESLVDDFFNEDELEEYREYNLNELLEEFKDVFGEDKLKKLLVDHLDAEESEGDEAEDEDSTR